MRYCKQILVALFAAVLAFGITACGSNTESSSAGGASSSAAVADSASSSVAIAGGASLAAASDEGDASTQQALSEALSGEGLVSAFVGKDVTDVTVANEEDAEKAIGGLIERMGGDTTTDLQLVAIVPTDTGTTYYVFRQEASGVMVHGGSAKLIVDKNGKVAGLVSSILPDVKLPAVSESDVSQEVVEKTVADTLASEGMADAKVVSECTTQAIIPMPNVVQRYILAWIVYVASPANDGDDQAYLANYVSMDGTYLYNIPVSEPNNAEALSGQRLEFDFSAYNRGEQTFDVTTDGKTSQVTVPVLTDKQSGKVAFLGDAERQIVCADFVEASNTGQIASPFEEDGESFNDFDLVVYANFIRVYDVFDTMGWHGPNGQGAPALLLMNYMEDGKPGDNCAYVGQNGGWEAFAFGRVRNYSLATDVVAHEYTHCVTSTTMTTNLYLNEAGAINEGMSDIMGNLVEMMLDGDEGAWVIGEQVLEGGMRSMSDPISRIQPESRWGIYYAPNVGNGTDLNDRGGVHGNSSLLNIISYKLYQAGMGVSDQGYFWMNVALAMVPTTDFIQMAKLLPWVMEQSGYGQHVEALNRAIDEAGYAKLEQPSGVPAGAGVVELEYPDADAADTGNVRITFKEKDRLGSELEADTWPAANTTHVSVALPAGDYYVIATTELDQSTKLKKLYTEQGWVEYDGDNESVGDKGSLVHVEEGQVIELATAGLV